MNAAINAASWVVGKALAPVADTVLEAWAASKELGPNVEALKMELLYVQAMLGPHTDGKQETSNPALELLLQKLRDLAYDSEDVLDELDYFRIQDELDGTSEAADEHAKGCCHNLVLNARSTAKAVGKQLLCSSTCCSASAAAAPGPGGRRRVRATSHSDQVHGCMPKLVSSACNTVRHAGKCFPCASLPPVRRDDDVLLPPGVLLPPHGASIHHEAPKLRFNRVDISKRMRVVVEQLRPMRQEVSKILRTLGSTWRSTNPHIAQTRPTTTSESIEPKLYGRDDIMNSIVYDITQGKYCDKSLTVLPVVGPGGIGKTTLAQHIYHNQQVQNHFQVMVWKCVSLNFKVDVLTEDIQKYIPTVQDEKMGTPAELIAQRLKSKRFLLVLDDMWDCGSEDEWKRLLLPFRKSQVEGNLIIVTTRIPRLAEMVKTTHHSIELEGLDHAEFKELFLAFVFDEDQSRQDHTVLLETGDKIMGKLKGSPLAAKTVGRLLRNHLDLDHWTRVLESKEWELQTDHHDIMPALKISYDHLPFCLQQCFSYCALFPQDYEFGSKELIHFWIGLDILYFGDKSISTDEDIGLRNINDLVSYGFFKKVETYGRPYYLIHDLLHDLASKVASHECLRIHSYDLISGDTLPLDICSIPIRHLSIILHYSWYFERMTDENTIIELNKLRKALKVEKLQSLMVFGGMSESFSNTLDDLFGEKNTLRLLCLPKMEYALESILHSFSTVIHLRYLRLGRSRNMKTMLPSTLSRFYHLKILDLEEWQGTGGFPRDMSNLLNLRHFLTHYDQFHSHISNVGKLKLLQELKWFQVNKESNGFELKQIGNMIELRELGIYNLEKINTSEEATEAKLIDKRHLHKLTLDWDNDRPSIEHVAEASILESLQPHRKLHELCIRGHGGPSSPTWLGDCISKNLQYLHLDSVAWQVFPPLGQMPVLRELVLANMSTVKEFGPRHFGSITEQSFQNLKKLAVIGLEQLEKWVLGDACRLLSQLQVLIIKKCPKLLELPFDNICDSRKHNMEGKVNWFPNLQTLEIENCPKVKLLPPIPWTRTLCSVKMTDVGSSPLYIMDYSKINLEIVGRDGIHSLDEQTLVFNNLTDVHILRMSACPPLELKHLQMLTSLTHISVSYSDHVIVPLGSEGEVSWHLPVEYLQIYGCGANGKELTELLSHFPKLYHLNLMGTFASSSTQPQQISLSHKINAMQRHRRKIQQTFQRNAAKRMRCENITRMGMVLEQLEQTTGAPSSSAVAKDDAQAVCHEWQITVEAEGEVMVDDGLLILPAHLGNSLRELHIANCLDLSLEPSLSSMGYEARGGANRGGLQALNSLHKLRLINCPKFLSAYKTLSSSYCPFPSSLQTLWLCGVEGMGTLKSLSNLTSLTILQILSCGEDLKSDGLWSLVTRGQLRSLRVTGSPKFFAGSDPWGDLQDEYQEQLLRYSSKLRELTTDDVAVFATPICSILSSSLIRLGIVGNREVERFTKEQENALQLLTSLRDLEFRECNKLQCLPSGLDRLPNLTAKIFRPSPMAPPPPETSSQVRGNEEPTQQ